MVKDLIGYRFSPTGEELVNYYLKNKNLGSNTWLVDEAIREINILSHEPEFLPSLAKIQSDDLNWYFFSRIEYTNAKKNAMKRSTGSGFWKPTGKDRIIRDKRGNGVQIGLKKTLVYHEGKVPNGVRTDWVMHEYHITCLPHHQTTYVICQVMYKNEPSQSLVFDPKMLFRDNSNPTVQPQAPHFAPDDDKFLGGLRHVDRGQVEYLFENEDIPSGGNYWSEPSQSLVSDSNTARAMVNMAPEFEQPGPENLDGLSLDDLMIPMNEQGDLCMWDVLDPKMSFSDNNNPTVQPQAPHLAPNDDEFLGELRHVDRGQDEYMYAIEECIPRLTTSMIDNRNDHRPKKPLSGIIYSSDSDINAELISAMSYQGSSSPGDSVGSPNRYSLSCSRTDFCKDLQTSADSSISRNTREYQLARRTIPSKQEVKQGAPRAIDVSIMKTEKKGWFITEEAMERNSKNPRYIYLMRMIIGFILLLALIGKIISALLTIKA